MSFSVETGSGIVGATSYLSEADADAYWADHGAPAAWSALSSAAKETALILGTQYLDAVFGVRWIGSRYSSTQALDWPRDGVVLENFLLDRATLPSYLEHATAELALLSQTETDGLLPNLGAGVSGAIKKTFDKVGPIATSIEYTNSGSTARKVYTLAEGILNRLLTSGGLAARA